MVKVKFALEQHKLYGDPVWTAALPESVDHELLLLFAHTNGQQRPDLPQGGQQVDGVLDRGGADGVGLPHGPQQLPDAVVLPPQQAEHLADQLGVLDLTLLSPADHRLRDQLLQVGWIESEKERKGRDKTKKSVCCFIQLMTVLPIYINPHFCLLPDMFTEAQNLHFYFE